MTPHRYQEIRRTVQAGGYGHDIDWSENVKAPALPMDFAREAIFVICNSGMNRKAARVIYDRVIECLQTGNSPRLVFRHEGKVDAIIEIWRGRAKLLAEFLSLLTDEERLAWCATLPWVGPITKYHLAKNLGVDCAKPDRWLDRIAALYDTDTHTLCKSLSEATGDRIATVDYVLWRAAAEGWMRELKPIEQTPREIGGLFATT
ncbi:MAG: hypothetical protein QNJ09_18465 [Paracoccaceae bacterium]|nr:hypothetical protein [Paracoccaceae bacterium]